MAKGLFVDGSVIYRNMQIWRTQLCPFGEIMALVPQQSSVLDIGCGGGLFLGLLAASGRIREGTGIDTSLPAIAQAEVMRSSHPNGAQLAFECLAPEEPFPDKPYDVITANDVMHHIPPKNQKLFFERLAGRVQPGGKLIYKDVADKPFWRVMGNQFHDLVLARQWVRPVPGDRICTWAEQCELQLRKRTVVNTLWYAHEIFLFERS